MNQRVNGVIVSGVINAATPPTNNKLEMFEPIILPINMSDKPFLADVIVTANSGIEVPKAITLMAINSSLYLKIWQYLRPKEQDILNLLLLRILKILL